MLSGEDFGELSEYIEREITSVFFLLNIKILVLCESAIISNFSKLAAIKSTVFNRVNETFCGRDFDKSV